MSRFSKIDQNDPEIIKVDLPVQCVRATAKLSGKLVVESPEIPGVFPGKISDEFWWLRSQGVYGLNLLSFDRPRILPIRAT